MENPKIPNYFIGMKIEYNQDRDTLCISLNGYITKAPKCFGIEDKKSINMPIDTTKFDRNESKKVM